MKQPAALPARLRAAQFLSGLAISAMVAAVLPAAEVHVSCGRLAADSPWETEFFVRDSGVDGPTVMIVGGAHGNEPAGAEAAEQICQWPLARGKMVVVPKANVIALEGASRYTSGESQSLRNLNRNYPRAGRDEPPRGALAAAIWELAKEHEPDWLLDLHEGYDFHRLNSDSVGSSVIVADTAAAKVAATRMLSAVNATIDADDKRFVPLERPVDGSLARAAAEHLGAHAMTLETTRKNQPLSLRTRQHRLLVQALLSQLEMLADEESVRRFTDEAARKSRLDVAVYDGGGTSGKGVPRMVEILRTRRGSSLAETREIYVAQIGPADICDGVLTQFDVVIFSGGSGSGQAAALGDEGRKMVSEFVNRGGGFVGVCAGAYLACEGFSWGLNVLDAKTVSPKWRRGRATLKLEVTPRGREIFPAAADRFDVLYANGPILEPSPADELPPYEPLLLFRSEVAENGSPAGVMVGSPAAVCAECGRGRVICFSPHPEQTEGLDELIVDAVKWSAAGETRQPAPAE